MQALPMQLVRTCSEDPKLSVWALQFGERAARAATHAKRAPCLAKSVLIALAGRVCTRLLCPCQKGLEPRIEK